MVVFSEGGGILNDAIVVMRDPRFILGDYGGKRDMAVPMLSIKMMEVSDEGEELEHNQYFSVGGAKDFIPDDTGTGLVKVGDRSAIVKTSNYALLMQSILDAGFPPERIKENDITFLNNLKCHVTRIAVKREGMDKKDTTAMVVDKIFLDDDKKGKGKTGAKAGTKAGAKAVDTDAGDDLVEEAKTILMEIILSDEVQADEGKLPKNKIISPLLTRIKTNPNKVGLMKLITSDEFLNLRDGWEYEKSIISIT